jgi:DNA-binding NtrC family response regulator
MTQPADRRSTVVIAEDEADLLSMVSDMVEECGLVPVPCATGQAAHDHLAAHAADVRALFADIKLRDSIDGVALALTTAERYPWIGICVTSGTCAARPAVLPQKVRFLAKPWRAAEVLAFIEGVADD